MTDKFKITGEWFIPTNTENRITGILLFDPNEGTELELFGSLLGDKFFPEFINQEIILGISNGEQITLYSCTMTKFKGGAVFANEESGKPSTIYSVEYLLKGLHVKDSTELVFNQISSDLFNLGEWIGISGFDQINNYFIDTTKKDITKIEYKLPENIEFQINNNTKGKFIFRVKLSDNTRYQKAVTVSQSVEFQVISDNEKSISELLKDLFIFQNFLSLALYKSTYPLSITLSGEKHKREYSNGEFYQKAIKLYLSFRNFKPNEKPKIDEEMIFSYWKIKSDFSSIIYNWYSKYELLEPSFDLVFEQFYNENSFSVNTFLNLAQSAETFHARVHNHTRIPRDQYKKMKEDILKITPNEYHIWLNDQFDFGNNLNLDSRLTELVDKYSNNFLDRILGDKSTFVLNVKRSRNYYTHYSINGQKKALKGAELYYLSEKLKILLVCSFLMEVGFDKDKLSQSLDLIKWRLFNHLANWKDDKKIKH
jgi:hypothetical protein